MMIEFCIFRQGKLDSERIVTRKYNETFFGFFLFMKLFSA